jgi:uncharacterized protein (TIGR02246 family)
MRRTGAVCVAIGLALAMTAIEAQAQAGKGKTDPAITKLAKEFADTFNTKDAAKLATLYTDDAVVSPPNEPAVRGRSSIEAFFKKMFTQGVTDLVLMPAESAISGTQAYEAGSYTLSVKPASGPTINDKGKYVVVLKQVGGKWLLAHDIFNSDLAPPGAPPAP